MRVRDEATGMVTSRMIRAGRLRELLDGVPDDAKVCVNAVGNLAIVRADLSGQLGYIDVASESRSSECDLFGDVE